MLITKAGPENTEKVIKLSIDEAKKRGIKYIVVNLIVVTHNVGFKEEGVSELKEELKEEIIKKGGIVLTSTMVLRNLGTAIREKMVYSQQDLVANTLRMLGQGIKVTVEITAMSADAGLIPCEDVIAIAGTKSGSDTSVVIKANSSNRFFDIKIKEILAKPSEF